MTDTGTKVWPIWKLAVLLYVFVAAAVAINLFLLGLLLYYAGGPAISPIQSLIAALPLGLPATWAMAIWVRGLLNQAAG